jgi:hypothetical protein
VIRFHDVIMGLMGLSVSLTQGMPITCSVRDFLMGLKKAVRLARVGVDAREDVLDVDPDDVDPDCSVSGDGARDWLLFRISASCIKHWGTSLYNLARHDAVIGSSTLSPS